MKEKLCRHTKNILKFTLSRCCGLKRSVRICSLFGRIQIQLIYFLMELIPNPLPFRNRYIRKFQFAKHDLFKRFLEIYCLKKLWAVFYFVVFFLSYSHFIWGEKYTVVVHLFRTMYKWKDNCFEITKKLSRRREMWFSIWQVL